MIERSQTVRGTFSQENSIGEIGDKKTKERILTVFGDFYFGTMFGDTKIILLSIREKRKDFSIVF